jgi:pentatricopeptide repeat protein
MAEDRAIEPNDIVLGCMLDALVCNSQIDEAVMLFDEWKVKVPPNMVMCSTIIKGFANTRQGPRAMKMWRDMHASGISMNTVLYNVAIDAQARIGAMDEVSELVEAMAPDGCQPDAITYSTIVKGYCVKGDLDKAYEVFTNTQQNNMAYDAIIYNTVLDGCTRHGRWDIADKILQDMERNKVPASSFTLGILVKMYGRRHQLDKAFEAVEELPKKHGFMLNAQVSTCLMCACLNNNAVERAIAVFEELKASGHGADAKAYGALIAGCTRHGQPETAVNLVEEAYGLKESKRGRGLPHGQSLEPEPLEQLFRALQQQDLMKRLGAPLLEKLRVAKAPVSGRLFNSLVAGNKGDCTFHRGGVANGAQRRKFNAGCT